MPLHLLCEANAELKARAVSKNHSDATVIGADTLVYIDDTPLGKPRDEADAQAMLMRLSGRSHQVCTGVCIVRGEDAECFHTITEVVFKKLSPEFIRQYMSMVNVMDKAGSYAAQEYGELIIEEFRGDYDNVVGLPLTETLRRLLPST